MINYIRQVMNPVWYHGHGADAPFFEGWYYKLVNQDETQRWAIIPGVFIAEDKSKTHAFIQILNGNTGKATYHTFKSFEAKENDFDVRIDTSFFKDNCIKLDIDDDEGRVSGELRFEGLNPWPVSVTAPGVMGWYGWMPNLECYHGVTSFDHRIEGTLNLYGEDVDFTGGRGYMEKDWGKNFPEGYIWQQTNHFETAGTSLTASIATFPFRGRTIPGFIVGLWHGGALYPFTTYNNSTVDTLKVDDDKVEWTLYNGDYELVMTSYREAGGVLKSPEKTDMIQRVEETMKARIDVRLSEIFGPRKTVIFEQTGHNAGLEVVGDLSLLLT